MSVLDKIPMVIKHHKVGDKFTLNKVRLQVCKTESLEDCNKCYFYKFGKTTLDSDCMCPPNLSCSDDYNNGDFVYFKYLYNLK